MTPGSGCCPLVVSEKKCFQRVSLLDTMLMHFLVCNMIHLPEPSCRVDPGGIPILQMTKLRLSEGKEPVYVTGLSGSDAPV